MRNKRIGRAGKPRAQLGAIVRAEETTCWRCGHPIDKRLPPRHRESFSVDHIIPISINPGLAYVRSNLRAAHYGCNSARGNRTDEPALITSRRW
jgi:5-methylcytosine-specific restriction endonuclease McrA